MQPFLITGNAHSGTGWASELFTRLGFPCGHEQWFNTDSHELLGSDSSWLAVPFLDELPVGTPIIHLVRHPVKVLKSYLRTDEQEDPYQTSPHYRFMCTHRPYICNSGSLPERAVRRVCTWDEPLFHMNVLRVRIEDCQDPVVVKAMVQYATDRFVSLQEVDQQIRFLGTDHNAHARKTGNSFSAKLLNCQRIRNRVARLGYRLDQVD